MKIIDRLKFVMSNNFDEFIRKYLQGDEVPDLQASPDEMLMKYSAVFACFRVLAETFASVPVFEYQKQSNGDRKQTDETGLFDILHYQPNEEMTAYNFKESRMYNICAGGNSVCARLYNKKGNLAGLYPILYTDLEIRRNDANKLEYGLISDKNKIYGRQDVFHVPGPSMDGVIGMSILEYARGAIDLGRTYENFGQKFYDKGAFPTGVFEHPGHLNDIAYKRVKEQLQKNYTGLKNSGTPMLLEHGLTYNPVSIKPIDAQLIESRQIQIEDVCRFCRVPPHMVQDLRRSTHNNIEHQSLEFVMYTMLPYIKRDEENINTQLLTPKQRAEGYYFEYNINALLRGDAASMAEAFATGRQWGWLSVNDIRRLLNMNRVDNGDIYLQPLNMIEAGLEVEDAKKTDTFKNLIQEMYKLIDKGGKNV